MQLAPAATRQLRSSSWSSSWVGAAQGSPGLRVQGSGFRDLQDLRAQSGLRALQRSGCRAQVPALGALQRSGTRHQIPGQLEPQPLSGPRALGQGSTRLRALGSGIKYAWSETHASDSPGLRLSSALKTRGLRLRAQGSSRSLALPKTPPGVKRHVLGYAQLRNISRGWSACITVDREGGT